jgi:Tfp pilus assembly protein PilV
MKMVLKFCSRLRLRPRGFSLVDVLIGMVVLAIALMSAFLLSIETSRLTSQNMHLSAATALAEFKLEELRNTNFASIVTGSDSGTIDEQGNPGGIFSRAWTVADNLPVTGLKTVAVTVSWTQWAQTRTYVLSGVIGP